MTHTRNRGLKSSEQVWVALHGTGLLKLAENETRHFEAGQIVRFPDGHVHGFKNTDDYWTRGSAKPHLHTIRVPTLVVNALNDPFVPGASLPRAGDVGAHVTLWQPQHGGHVGFPHGPPPGHVRGMPESVGDWLGRHR
jgi:predicted alpha/beta-fold hydrolase